jgi:hypothetical protein
MKKLLFIFFSILLFTGVCFAGPIVDINSPGGISGLDRMSVGSLLSTQGTKSPFYINDVAAGRPLMSGGANAQPGYAPWSLVGTNGAAYNLDEMGKGMTFSRTLNINPAAEEIEGVQYQSVADALDYIGTQSPVPSAANRWALYVSGTLGENIDLGNMAYVNIVGVGSALLMGKVDNTGTANGIKLNTLIAERPWSIYNCDIMDFSPSGNISFSSLINCRIGNGTPAANTAILMDGCTIFNGDYSGVILGFLKRCIINHGTFGNPYGFTFRVDDSYVMGESAFDESVIAYNTIFEDSGAYHSTPSLNGGVYYNCLFLGGIHVNFPNGAKYTFDSCIFEDPRTYDMSGATGIQLELKNMSHPGDITIGTSNKLTTNNCNLGGKVNVGEGGTWVNVGPHIIGGIGSFDHLEVPAMTPVNAVAAATTLTASALPANTDWVVAWTGASGPGWAPVSRYYYFKDTLDTASTTCDVLIGANVDETMDNLENAINHDEASANVDYVCATADPFFSAADGATGSSKALTAKTKGISGNSINLQSTSNFNWSGIMQPTGGVDGTVSKAGGTCMDSSYFYYCIADNTVAGANWRRIAHGSAF